MMQATGAHLLRELRRLPAEELERPADDLVDQYGGPRCDDCGRRHYSPYEALVCDERVDARRRRDAARIGRAVEMAERRLAGPGVDVPDREQDWLRRQLEAEKERQAS